MYDRFQALPTNIDLGWKGLTGTNTHVILRILSFHTTANDLAYYSLAYQLHAMI